MAQFFDTEYYGRFETVSHFSRCPKCNRLTVLNSYSTTRFLRFFSMPLLPVGQHRMMDECPMCGFRGTTSRRRFSKDRKRNLSLMMEGFTTDPDSPDNCCHALHTLMVYDEKNWFDDIRKSYGLRFENHMQVQLIIAQAMCRFGEYEEAIAQCRKAIVLGAGKQAEELMSFCFSLLEASDGKESDLHKLVLLPESTLKAYIPLSSLGSLLLTLLVWQGISAVRTHRAWLVNGSLMSYNIELDGRAYSLTPGSRKQIKLKLGEHELEMDGRHLKTFDYSIPFFKQLLGKHLLVINPDAMALIQYDGPVGPTNSYCCVIHNIPGMVNPLFGFQTRKRDVGPQKHITLFWPGTHAAMLREFQTLELTEAARNYARHALRMDPASPEAGVLLETAISGLDDRRALAFLRTGMELRPPLLSWHRQYQRLRLMLGERDEVVREYSERCTAHPDQPEWPYLLGYVVDDREKARKFFLFSEKGRGLNGIGFQAIAENCFFRGEYAEALPWIIKALNKDPDNPAFIRLHRQILLARRDYDGLLKTVDTQSPETKKQTVLYLTLAGYHQEAEDAVRHFSDGERDAARLNAIRFHAVGNMNAYLQCLADSDDPHAELQKLYHLNRIEEANALLSAEENHPWWEHLVMYCAAMNNQRTDIAETHLQKAIAEIGTGTPEQRMAAALLQVANPDPEQIRQLRLPPEEKALLCTALAYRFPSQRLALLKLSGLYNFEPTYPWLYLKRWNKALKARPSANRQPVGGT